MAYIAQLLFAGISPLALKKANQANAGRFAELPGIKGLQASFQVGHLFSLCACFKEGVGELWFCCFFARSGHGS